MQRYLTEDCEDYPADQRRAGVSIAEQLARRSRDALVDYIRARREGETPDARTTELLRACFNGTSITTALTAAIGFRSIMGYLEGDDFTIECEDDCDDENAYVYAFWTDIHMCMNKIASKGDRRFGEILLHEVSHVAAGTDDEEYFYPPAGSETTLSPSDALDNADSYEAFAAQA